jgi:hypothetical protein
MTYACYEEQEKIEARVMKRLAGKELTEKIIRMFFICICRTIFNASFGLVKIFEVFF